MVMTTRRFNYTERRKILREDAAILLRAEQGGVGFEAHLRLSDYKLPQDALVVVEAYKAPVLMRFDMGSVALPKRPVSTLLTEFDPPEGVRFRVKVMGVGDQTGRLLAVADQVTPQGLDEQMAGQRAIITTEGADLGEIVWTLSLEQGPDLPRLKVNEKLGDWRSIARSPHFTYLVYPEVLRQILNFVLMEAGWDREDPDDWCTQWIRFGERLPGVGAAPEKSDPSEDRVEWIAEAVQSFCRSRNLRERFSSLLTGEAE